MYPLTFSSSGRFSRYWINGFEYSANVVTVFVSVRSIPDPVRSNAVGWSPTSSNWAMVLYQHQAPKPSPCIRIILLNLTFSRDSSTYKYMKIVLDKFTERSYNLEKCYTNTIMSISVFLQLSISIFTLAQQKLSPRS